MAQLHPASPHCSPKQGDPSKYEKCCSQKVEKVLSSFCRFYSFACEFHLVITDAIATKT